jgi:hypothetical protein
MFVKLLIFCIVAFSACSVWAENRITFFRDGTLHQQETGAVKGIIEVPLAAGLLEQTLTVFPAHGTTIVSVDIYKPESGGKTGNDLELLLEKRKRLEDRLQALETRETIFTAAAKSQSGKTPRKSKTNPDPMQTIRKGTDFAIAQLEEVYTARRRTNQELQKIDASLSTARRKNRSAEKSVRIAVIPPRGKVTLRYATTERGWEPHYNLMLDADGKVRMQLFARITGEDYGVRPFVSSASLAEVGAGSTAAQSGKAVLADYLIPFSDEQYREGIFNRLSGVMTNSSSRYLPPGESTVFRRGVYLGKFRFDGLSSGRSGVVSVGK